VDGQGWLFLNDPLAAADLSILPCESCFTAPVDELLVCLGAVE
jgi:hypothetical protein